MSAPELKQEPRIIGRYALYGKIASGGRATVHFGRLLGPVGFSRTVAIKRLHPQYTEDPDFVSMFLDEARLAGRIRHPNVVATLDVVATDEEIFLVMDYVQGETLSRLVRLCRLRSERVPLPIVAAIFSGVLHGLHAAHEAKTERGEPLGIVHRDVSPQNMMVGVDGAPRVLDFGVAKAAGRIQTTREGQLKGKLGYMAPEQIQSTGATRQTDVYAAGAVLWECLTGKRLFQDENDGALLRKVLEARVEPPSKHVADLPPGLDDIVLRAVERDPAKRFASAREMATAIESLVPLAVPAVIGAWVEATASEALAKQAAVIREIESDVDAMPLLEATQVRPLTKEIRPMPAPSRSSARTVSEAPVADARAPVDPRSGMSSISVESSEAAAGHRRKGVGLAVCGLLAATLLMGLFRMSFRQKSATTPDVAAAGVVPGTEVAASATQAPAAPVLPPPRDSAPSASVEPAGTASVAASSAAPSRPRLPKTPAARPVSPAPRPPPAAPSSRPSILFTNPG